jgi:calcineurin-like phosphoesterase family protein
MTAFVIADTHWGHAKSLTFLTRDGERLRPFDSVEEMDELMVENWNKVVNNTDTVYHLGDVVIPRASLKLLGRLKGRKILIRGNHDRFKLKDYAEHFEDIRGAHYHQPGSTFLGGLIMTHIPVHPENLQGHYRGNIHGHLHLYKVMDGEQEDRKYFNACVECNNFTPVAFDTVLDYFRKQKAPAGQHVLQQ